MFSQIKRAFDTPTGFRAAAAAVLVACLLAGPSGALAAATGVSFRNCTFQDEAELIERVRSLSGTQDIST